MAYEKQIWVDNETPIDAEHLNHMEEGISGAYTGGAHDQTARDAIRTMGKPRVYIDGVIPTTKDDVLAEMRFEHGAKSWHAYIKIKCQGSSSMAYPKKNFTVKLYEDEARTVEKPVTLDLFKQPSNKYVMKANWTDHSHARNVVVARLWSQILATQPGYADLPEELRNSPNNGAINGFPVLVYTNGTYRGLYTWNIGKDPWMWGMDEDNPNHALIAGNFNTAGTNVVDTACNFRELWDGTDKYWEIEIGNDKDALVESFNRVISCVKDTTDVEFKERIGTYLDIQSVIDYDLQLCTDHGSDNVTNNLLMATYDMTKWRCGRYDNDGTYGNTASGFQNMTQVNAEHLGATYGDTHSLLWSRFEKIFAKEYKERGRELRKSVLSFANINANFEKFIAGVGAEAYADENIPYPDIPIGEEPRYHFRDWVRDRLTYFDGWLEGLKEYVLCEGISFDKTNLNFTSEAPVTLTATLAPSNCNDDIVWMSSNPAIAYVTGGVVTPVADGSATITAACGGQIAECQVTVSGVGDLAAPLYSLAAPVTIATVDDIVDTGATVFDEEGSFTIALDLTPVFADGISGGVAGALVSAYVGEDNRQGYLIATANAYYNDFLVQTHSTSGDWANKYVNIRFNTSPSAGTRIALVIRYNQGEPNILHTSASTGGEIVTNSGDANFPYLFKQGAGNLYLGCGSPRFDTVTMQYTKPELCTPCTIHRCELYKRYLSDDEVAEFIGGMTE